MTSVDGIYIGGAFHSDTSNAGVSSDNRDAYFGVLSQKDHQLADLTAMMDEAHPNLVDIKDGVSSIEKELLDLLKADHLSQGTSVEERELVEQISQLQNTVKSLQTRLTTKPLASLLREQEKWVAAGYDKELLVSDPEAVHFAVSSKLIYTIGMFEKTADILDGEKLTIRNDHGVALFKVEGEWLPYSSFKDMIVFSETEYRFIGWNFVHPDGFIPRDWAAYTNPYPIAKLSPEGYQKVKAQADLFWSKDQPEIDPGVEKGYILQIMTTGRSNDWLPQTWWARNFSEHFPEHGSARLITPEGYVYSFGTKMRFPDQEFLSHLSTYLGTGISNVPMPDYEEPRSSEDRMMTSVPLSKDRFDKSLDFVHRANKGLSFNFARQNCIRFVQTILGIAGVEVSTRMPLHEVVGDLIPRVSDIPVVGKPMALLCAKVSAAVILVFDTISHVLSWITPYPLKKVWEFAVWTVTVVLQRIDAVFWNSIALFVLGASSSIVPDERMQATDLPEVDTFHKVMNWTDIFTPDAIPIYYVTRLKQWMRKQQSTLLYLRPEHGFCCFDPSKAAFRSPLVV